MLAVLLVAGSGLAVRGAAERVRTGEDEPPARVEVSCSADGIALSSRRVAAGPAGVTFAVSSTMGDDGYLFFDASEYRFGEPLPPLAEEWVRPVPPGVVELTCSADGLARAGDERGRAGGGPRRPLARGDPGRRRLHDDRRPAVVGVRPAGR